MTSTIMQSPIGTPLRQSCFCWVLSKLLLTFCRAWSGPVGRPTMSEQSSCS